MSLAKRVLKYASVLGATKGRGKDPPTCGDCAGLWFVLKILLIPAAMIPGRMPRNGVSKLIVPRMLCFSEILSEDFIRTTSAASMPPRLCPQRIMSVFGDSWGVNLLELSMYVVIVVNTVTYQALKWPLAICIASFER